MSLIKKVEIMKLGYDKCMASVVFRDPLRKINDNYLRIDNYIKQFENLIKIRIEKERSNYIELIAKLDALSPLKTLYRGYSIIEKDGKVVKSINELEKEQIINIRLSDGNKKAVIK